MQVMKLLSLPSKGQIIPTTPQGLKTVFEAKNIPQAVAFILGLRVLELILDAGIKMVTQTTIDKETSVKIDLATGELQFGKHGVNLDGRAQVIEIIDAYDIVNYFLVSGFNLKSFDVVTALGIIIWQIIHNVTKLTMTASAATHNSPFNFTGKTSSPQRRAFEDEEVAHL